MILIIDAVIPGQKVDLIKPLANWTDSPLPGANFYVVLRFNPIPLILLGQELASFSLDFPT